MDELFPTTVEERIARALARGAQVGFGERPLGLGPEQTQALERSGTFGPNPTQQIIEALARPAAKAGDFLMRAPMAIWGGISHAGGQVAEELGDPSSKQLTRDLTALPDAYAGMMPGALRPSQQPSKTAKAPAVLQEAYQPKVLERSQPTGYNPPEAQAVRSGRIGSPGYAYHATSADNLESIANEGLRTHLPGDFTDQVRWPDGHTGTRNYFTPTAENTWQFAPAEGQPVLLRIRRLDDEGKPSLKLHLEAGTSDLYGRDTAKPQFLEVLGKDGKWVPITDYARKSGVGGRPLTRAPLGDTNKLLAGIAKHHEDNYIAPPFYSELADQVGQLKLWRAPADQWLATLKNRPGVRSDELQYSGLSDWLSQQKGPVSKTDIQKHLKENQFQFQEVLKGDSKIPDQFTHVDEAIDYLSQSMDEAATSAQVARQVRAQYGSDEAIIREANRLWHDMGGDHFNGPGTKFSSYQLPGGVNYRELLLTVPRRGPFSKTEQAEWDGLNSIDPGRFSKEQQRRFEELRVQHEAAQDKRWSLPDSGEFRGSHWDEPNVLAHVRYNDRYTDAPTAEQLYDIKQRTMQALNTKDHTSLASGSPEVAVRRGAITEQEAAQLSHAMKWQNKYQNAPGARGNKTLFLEELQSDWHQQGREKGYTDTGGKAKLDAAKQKEARLETDFMVAARHSLDPVFADKSARQLLDHIKIYPNWHQLLGAKDPAIIEAGNAYRAAYDERHMIQASHKTDGVPDAPFKKDWHELLLKRMIREAAAKGYDQLAWTTGAQQAKRYDLSKHVGEVHYGGSNLVVYSPKGERVQQLTGITADELPNYIGKELSQKLLAQTPGTDRYRKLDGLDLQVGGEGMKGFYDKILVDAANKLGKRYGARVRQTNLKGSDLSGRINDLEDLRDRRGLTRSEQEEYDILAGRETSGTVVHSIPITKELKRAALKKGFPLFSAGAIAVGATGEEE